MLGQLLLAHIYVVFLKISILLVLSFYVAPPRWSEKAFHLEKYSQHLLHNLINSDFRYILSTLGNLWPRLPQCVWGSNKVVFEVSISDSKNWPWTFYSDVQIRFHIETESHVNPAVFKILITGLVGSTLYVGQLVRQNSQDFDQSLKLSNLHNSFNLASFTFAWFWTFGLYAIVWSFTSQVWLFSF